MAFDDRHIGPLLLLAIGAITIAVATPVLQAFGFESWRLAVANAGCVAGVGLTVVLLLNLANISEWLRRRLRRND